MSSGRRRAGQGTLPGGRWLSPLLALLLWEAGSRTGLIPPRVLAAPSDVFGTMLDMTLSGELPANLVVSLQRVGLGVSLGIVIGLVTGLVSGLSRVGEQFVDPLMQIKRTIPSLALTPLLILWLGIGEAAKVALIAFATMFPIYLNLYGGIRNIDVRLIDAARSFGLSRAEIIGSVVLPGTMPSLLIGLRYAMSVSILVLVVAEQVNASAGLGYLVNNARDFMRTDIIVMCILVYALLGLGADWIIRRVEARLLQWRPDVTGIPA